MLDLFELAGIEKAGVIEFTVPGHILFFGTGPFFQFIPHL
jgi:hypothetical protein